MRFCCKAVEYADDLVVFNLQRHPHHGDQSQCFGHLFFLKAPVAKNIVDGQRFACAKDMTHYAFIEAECEQPRRDNAQRQAELRQHGEEGEDLDQQRRALEQPAVALGRRPHEGARRQHGRCRHRIHDCA